MKTLTKVKPGLDGVKLLEIEEPQIKSKEIKVKIHAAGICGTDMHIIKDEYPCNYPVVMGHEYAGTVMEVGSEVTEFQIGDRVVSLTAAVTCKDCEYCRSGLFMLCDERLSIGSGVNGAFAQFMVIPEEIAYKIPSNVTLEEAALTEPLACMVRCVIERGSVKAGDYVLISGPGTIGLLTMQVAKANGGNVIVIGTSADRERLHLAAELGAFTTIVIDEEDVEQKITEITGGSGVDVAFECAGVEASAHNCLKLLKKTGLYIQVGLYGKNIMFDMDLALTKEINITNGFASEPTSWERALRLLENKQVNVAPLISTKFTLDQWQEAIDMVDNKQAYKVLFIPNGE
ncbi:zinc-binding dehydrogenase [Bacillus sp. FJAT-50079]|uniref:zinc-dependent alcohol dehydrogenase n=1 Tax=Bacillus sp. FJAT-50079 TaxID=2833577 RepID=UPI001BCA086B|nr:zinc-binding dehydrogenase [Bacillus sp. FJAT-50079]MBS4208869.1 zinc-binding dehydrogenase [Bacillus sp. FJAT-50079]